VPNITVKEEILVAAPPERVFDYTQDYAHRAKWDDAVLEAKVVADAPERMVWVRGPGGFESTLHYRLFDRPKMTSLEMTDIRRGFGISGGGGSWRYEAADGGTRFTQQNTLVLKSRIQYWLFGWLLRWQLARTTRKAMARVKALIEGGAGG
jgi:hypothetical protein